MSSKGRGRISSRNGKFLVQPIGLNIDDYKRYKIVENHLFKKIKLADAVEFKNVSEELVEIVKILSTDEETNNKFSNVLIMDSERSVPINSNYHFYMVFNPLYNEISEGEFEGATQAHSFYNKLKTCDFLYWGKLSIYSGKESLFYENFKQVLDENTKNDRSTILYLSDFKNLWALKVKSVENKISKEDCENHSLNFYIEKFDNIELWFKVTDMTLLSIDHKDTIEEIANFFISPNNKLNNLKSKILSNLNITPYTSGLRYPLIIEHSNGHDPFFGLSGERFVDLIDSRLNEDQYTKSVIRNINTYVIPVEVFKKFPPIVQNEIIKAERTYGNLPQNHQQQKHELESVCESYLKCFERLLRYLIIEEFYSKISHTDFSIDFSTSISGKIVDFRHDLNFKLDQYNFTLGSFGILFKNRNKYLRTLKLQKNSFYTILEAEMAFFERFDLKDYRNILVHMDNDNRSLNIQELNSLRRTFLGVGCRGSLTSLVQSFYDLKDFEMKSINSEKVIPKMQNKRSA